MKNIFFILTIWIISFAAFASNDVNCEALSQKASNYYPENKTIVLTRKINEVKRSYFYSAPNEECKIKNLFIVNNDIVNIYKEYFGFSYGSYVSTGGKINYGWINSSNLTKLNFNEPSLHSKRIAYDDFAITNGRDWISLDSSFPDFVTKNPEMKELSNSFIGDFPVGDTAYKYYSYDYKDFKFIASNTFFDAKQRDIDDYYITYILIKDNKYKTRRGIQIGDPVSKLTRIYPVSLYNSGGGVVQYKYGDMTLKFMINNQKTIESIELKIQSLLDR